MIHKLHWWALTLCKWARALGGMSKCKSYHCLRAFHPNKNISLLHGLNRDPQDIFFKSQPGEESKDHLPGDTPGWQRDREVSCIPKKHPHISWSQLCTHSSHQARKASMSERGWATPATSRCDLCGYLLICHRCPCKYEANTDLQDSGGCTGASPEGQIHLRCDCDCHTSICAIWSSQGAAAVPSDFNLNRAGSAMLQLYSSPPLCLFSRTSSGISSSVIFIRGK